MTQIEGIEIRPLKTYAELEESETVQRSVWMMEVDTPIVPASILQPIGKNGGAVLGAFEGQKMVGFCFSFLGRTPDGELLHWSHMNGVLEGVRAKRVGEELKWAQRDAILGMGIDRVRWTMDPLEGRPSALNFGKLGVTCNTYVRNNYGSMPDGLNAGIESDRFIVDWELGSERVTQRRAKGRPDHSFETWQAEGATLSNPTERVTDKVRRVVEMKLDADPPQLVVETPGDYQDVKVHDLELAIEWRMQSRELFETYFKKGYMATEFVSEMTDEGRRNFFLLQKP